MYVPRVLEETRIQMLYQYVCVNSLDENSESKCVMYMRILDETRIKGCGVFSRMHDFFLLVEQFAWGNGR